MTFERFKLDPKIAAGVKALGYTSPTPVQAEAIPPIMEGRNIMGIAQTGTGKTAAFALPILQRLLRSPRGNVRALILSPTRELSEQTHEAIGSLGRKTGIRSLSIYGGVGMGPQVSALRRGVDIVAACPGRLLDHLNRGTIDLSAVEILVLDEADQMFDMGFIPDIRKILKFLPKKRQTLLFSATMPEDIRVLADEILIDPVRVRIGAAAPVETVSHTFYPVESDSKQRLLEKILKDSASGTVLVFTRTKHRSKTVAQKLERSGFGATALHGNLSQSNRKKAMDGFRSGRYRILVATDVASRGIDVAGISHVINFDVPETVDAYTHRIGRTGRAEETGEAFTFVCGQDGAYVRAIARILGNKLKYRSVEGFGCVMGRPDSSEERRRGASAVRRQEGFSRPSVFRKRQPRAYA